MERALWDCKQRESENNHMFLQCSRTREDRDVYSESRRSSCLNSSNLSDLSSKPTSDFYWPAMFIRKLMFWFKCVGFTCFCSFFWNVLLKLSLLLLLLYFNVFTLHRSDRFVSSLTQKTFIRLQGLNSFDINKLLLLFDWSLIIFSEKRHKNVLILTDSQTERVTSAPLKILNRLQFVCIWPEEKSRGLLTPKCFCSQQKTERESEEAASEDLWTWSGNKTKNRESGGEVPAG